MVVSLGVVPSVVDTGIVFNFGVKYPEGLSCEDFLRNNGLRVATLDATMLKPVSMQAQMARLTLS